jgi:hypothetical protein
VDENKETAVWTASTWKKVSRFFSLGNSLQFLGR